MKILAETTTTFIGITKEEVISALDEFYHNYVIDSANGAFQVFQSFTYGEMVISFLLFSILSVMVLKWLYEVVR